MYLYKLQKYTLGLIPNRKERLLKLLMQTSFLSWIK